MKQKPLLYEVKEEGLARKSNWMEKILKQFPALGFFTNSIFLSMSHVDPFTRIKGFGLIPLTKSNWYLASGEVYGKRKKFTL